MAASARWFTAATATATTAILRGRFRSATLLGVRGRRDAAELREILSTLYGLGRLLSRSMRGLHRSLLCLEAKMKRKLTPEEWEEIRRIDEEGRAARENMQRLIDEAEARQREREEREARRGFWSRLIPARRSA